MPLTQLTMLVLISVLLDRSSNEKFMRLMSIFYFNLRCISKCTEAIFAMPHLNVIEKEKKHTETTRALNKANQKENNTIEKKE
ncbi:CLUMA_CG010862, isoform A [Clunio marinus]|uniref:CLUMA_CG010862, isoform A n=1 Tax=Clunio marinus TaxID=568069 RepID=A0A1J1IG95_9DIPT|nr:CLUMA_CG010862, isoform A [Clunio marinus]